MNSRRFLVAVVALTIALGVGIAFAGQDRTGNGAPSGSHYNLNIIGVSKAKSVDPDDYANRGHRIFVRLGSRDNEAKTRILLKEGDFAVVDYDGTDGTAKFQLPDPDPENDGVTTYSVYVRGLGKPGNSAKIQPGFTDEDGVDWYTVEAMTVTVDNSARPNKFVNVSQQLLYVYVDMDDDGVVERYPLFSDEMWEFFWGYDNGGLRLCQLRFYPVSTDTN